VPGSLGADLEKSNPRIFKKKVGRRYEDIDIRDRRAILEQKAKASSGDR
jgi:hypothetical protein